jgi:ribosomal protein S18 acetylase RimI-like enzyme
MTLISDQLIYRNGNIHDVAQMRALGVVSYGQYAPQLSAENLELMLSRINTEQLYIDLLQTAHSFVCEYNNQLIGMAFLVPSGVPFRMFDIEWSIIRMVGVNPQFQGNGIAKRLTKSCINKAIENGEQTVALHTSEMMDAARHIYESLGFTVLKEIDPIFGKRYWIYTLSLAH